MENQETNKLPEYKGMHFSLPIEVTRYVITDALGNVAGKPKGYKSMAAALSVANRRDTKVYKQIRSVYENTYPESNLRTVFRVEACKFDINEL